MIHRGTVQFGAGLSGVFTVEIPDGLIDVREFETLNAEIATRIFAVASESFAIARERATPGITGRPPCPGCGDR